MTLVAASELKIGVLSRRAPISDSEGLGATLEHVGGLTRVLPALAEFAKVDWTTLTTQNQEELPRQYPFTEAFDHANKHEINIFMTEVNDQELAISDWFCARYIWPLLHDMPIPELANKDLDLHFNAIRSISRAMAAGCVDIDNSGYLVNDFQLSQVPTVLRELEPSKQITFFLHTPWPKSVSNESNAIKILEFLATGMLSADVIEFQTKKDMLEFETFVMAHAQMAIGNVKLEVNPVSVNVQSLQEQALSTERTEVLSEDEVSYVHIARSDPIKNTLACITAFTELAKEFNESVPRSYLDLYIVPSRQQWPEYQELLSEIVTAVEQCNSRLSSLNYHPIRIHIGNDYQRSIQALARYDYLLACSVADGLNLVVKEGAVLNNRNGVIVGTEFVGAMSELGEFCVLSEGIDEISIAKALREAGKLTEARRQVMSMQLKTQVIEFNASNWAKSVVANFKILEKV